MATMAWLQSIQVSTLKIGTSSKYRLGMGSKYPILGALQVSDPCLDHPMLQCFHLPKWQQSYRQWHELTERCWVHLWLQCCYRPCLGGPTLQHVHLPKWCQWHEFPVRFWVDDWLQSCHRLSVNGPTLQRFHLPNLQKRACGNNLRPRQL